MTTEELKSLIIDKQNELIKMFVKIIYKNYDKFSVSDDSKGIIIKLEDNIADLNQQLKQSESKLVKQPTEIRGENHNCKNCYYELITRQYNPCDICSDFDKWEPKLKQVESEPVKESGEISDENKKCENCKYYFSNLYDECPCSQCNWGEYNLKWEPKTE